MQKYFNITGFCYPEYHYMVNLEERLKQIKKLVDRGDYFVINRARQYGKSTILWALNQYLQEEYTVILLSFQRISSVSFESETLFAGKFAEELLKVVKNKNYEITGLDKDILSELERAVKTEKMLLSDIFDLISRLCDTSKKPIVLMIDEVDHASNYKVFLDFLAFLRDYYLYRQITPFFQSVILAGIYDIKNLKLKIRPEEEHRYNSPWNISADFDVDMSFSTVDITAMLVEYEQDYHIGMNVQEVGNLIYEYTRGYPYMVSYICKFLDEKLIGREGFTEQKQVWTKAGVLEAVKELLNVQNTLMDDMRKKIADYPKLKEMLYSILFRGQSVSFNLDHPIIEIGVMFGFIREKEGCVVIDNRIFETCLYNMFLSEELVNDV